MGEEKKRKDIEKEYRRTDEEKSIVCNSSIRYNMYKI